MGIQVYCSGGLRIARLMRDEDEEVEVEEGRFDGVLLLSVIEVDTVVIVEVVCTVESCLSSGLEEVVAASAVAGNVCIT